jgi:hypothetical protein
MYLALEVCDKTLLVSSSSATLYRDIKSGMKKYIPIRIV